MIKMRSQNTLSMGTLLNTLQNEKFITSTEFQKIEAYSLESKRTLPLYLRLLIALGALLAVFFFMGFFYISHIINFDSTAEKIVWGILFVLSGMVGGYFSKNNSGAVAYSFLIQTSYCAMWLGKTLLVMGLTSAISHTVSTDMRISIALFFITLLTYYLFPFYMDRLLSSFLTFFSLLMLLTQNFSTFTPTSSGLTLFFIVQLIITSFLFLYSKTKRDYMPLAYASALSLFAGALYLCWGDLTPHWGLSMSYTLTFINVSVVMALLIALYYSDVKLKELKTETLVVILIGLILLAFVTEPGVLVGLFFMVLGYGRRERPLLIIGMILLPVFLYFYYYNLDVSLWAKSIILASSGLLMLVARGYVIFRKLNKEEIA